MLEPLELLEKLAVLVPRPRRHLIHYHGVLASAASLRPHVVAARPEGAARRRSRNCRHPPAGSGGSTSDEPAWDSRPPGQQFARGRSAGAAPLWAFHPRRYCWPELIKRVYAIDVLDCPGCHGPLRILAAIHPPATTRAILDCLGLQSRPPPIALAEPEPI